MADKGAWIRIGAMWRKESKSGVAMFTGKLGDARIIVYPNNKTNDKQPDYIINVVESEKREGDDRGGGQQRQPQRQQSQQSFGSEAPEWDD